MNCKSRITFITVKCKRCGKSLTTASRSIHSLDNLKAKYGYICSDCTTPDEKNEMLMAIGQGIAEGK